MTSDSVTLVLGELTGPPRAARSQRSQSDLSPDGDLIAHYDGRTSRRGSAEGHRDSGLKNIKTTEMVSLDTAPTHTLFFLFFFIYSRLQTTVCLVKIIYCHKTESLAGLAPYPPPLTHPSPQPTQPPLRPPGSRWGLMSTVTLGNVWFYCRLLRS